MAIEFESVKTPPCGQVNPLNVPKLNARYSLPQNMAADSALIQISTVPSVDSFVKLVTNFTEIKNESVKVKFLQHFFEFFLDLWFQNFFEIFFGFFFEFFLPKFFPIFFSSQ